jgi:uncharacterized protein YecA (UPF0149 family)
MEKNIADLRNHIHQLINETDEDKLKKVQAYLITLQNDNADWWETISVQEKEIIYNSRKLLKEGKGISHSDVKAKVDSLLGRK